MSSLFRTRKNVKKSYADQGYIYFVSRRFPKLPIKKREQIEAHVKNISGEYWEDVLDAVTSGKSDVAICMQHNISESTLHRLMRKYYNTFPQDI